jgi:hypothetical protein
LRSQPILADQLSRSKHKSAEEHHGRRDGERQKLRAALFDLSHRELMDIGIARDEIDYIASQRSIDPRSG